MNKNNSTDNKRGQKSSLVRAAAVIAVICAGYILYAKLAHRFVPTPRPEQAVQRIVTVEDGDTGELQSREMVRYIGIDAPEEGEPFWFEATRLNAEFCLGEEVRLEYGSRRLDRYGRILAYVFVEDTVLVNEKLVEAGVAHVYLFPDDRMDPEYRDRLILAQKSAREAGRGIWSLPPPEPIESIYFGNPRSYRFHRPTCSAMRSANRQRLIEATSRDILLDSGYSPCRNCKP